MNIRRRLGLEWAGVALLTSVLVMALVHWDILRGFDNLLYDELTALDRPTADPDIVIVAIDESSLARYGKWPWPRDRHTALLNQLADARPAAIGYDILLSDQSDPESDTALANAIRRNRHIYLPLHFAIPGSNGADFDAIDPLPQIANAASGLGHVNLPADDDGMIRRFTLCFSDEKSGPPYLHLMERLYRATRNGPSEASKAPCNSSQLLPLAERNSFQTISFASVAEGEVPNAFLNGKILLVGAVANGLGDQFPVPGDRQATMPGVEIMANGLSALRNQGFISPLPKPGQLALSLGAVWVLLIGFWRWKPRTTLVMLVSIIAAMIALTVLLLNFQIWFPPGAALLVLILVHPLWGWRRLQATSNFMDTELKNFRSGPADIPIFEPTPGPVDIVTGQAEQLGYAIAYTRDLRRFISDALVNLPDPMFITDLNGQVSFINKLAGAGIGDDTLNLDVDTMLSRIVDKDHLDAVREYLAKPHSAGDHEYVHFTSRTGEVFALRRAPVLTDTGELRGHIHYLADITALAAAAEEREEVLELLSHDMRAPQAAILALLQDRPSEDQARRIAAHARRTLTLADNFVDLARMKAQEFVGEDVLIADLVSEASDNVWPLAKARQIACVIEDRSDSAFVHGEPSSLYRSFVNLLDNAIKYSPDNGTVSIALDRLTSSGIEMVSIAITDQGPGVANEMIASLFQRFTSTRDGARAGVKGTGLGLNFVAQVVERHRGSVMAKNLPNGGACFTILLPVAEDSVED